MPTKDGRGGARLGTGPKPKPPSQTRRNRVVIHLTDAELRQVRASAGKAMLAQFARETLLAAIARKRS